MENMEGGPCIGCKFYKQDPSIVTSTVFKCTKYNNIYSTRCSHYLEEGQEEPVEIPVDNSREFIDFSPVETKDETPTKEEQIKALEEQINKLRGGSEDESKIGNGSEV